VFACALYAHQDRKGSGIPYIARLMSVAALVLASLARTSVKAFAACSDLEQAATYWQRHQQTANDERKGHTFQVQRF
jgi:hypothetical protein